MINLALQTEYNFKQTFMKLEDILAHENKTGYLGIGDNNTFGHVKFEKLCNKFKIKPIFAVRLMVVDRPERKIRGLRGPQYIFIAKNDEGLKEINRLVKTSYDKFYYVQQIGVSDLLAVSENVFVISENPCTLERIDYLALTPSTPKMMLDFDLPRVFINNNRYSSMDDKEVYELLAGARKMGTGYNYLFNEQIYPQHVLSAEEFLYLYNDSSAIDNTFVIAVQCNAKIEKAPMVSYDGQKTIEAVCYAGAKRKGIDLTTEPYTSRFKRELGLIQEKEYTDYFLIVSDMIKKAKRTMLVGPSRGSSAGSLVCYLMDITEIDPIKHNLLFERFIDLNRHDLPDIDVDFPDTKRKNVIRDLIKKFNAENVCHISNISRLRAKSALNELAMSLSIPKWEIEELKDSMIERGISDERADLAATDTLLTTETGKEFLEKYPAMKYVEYAENHATHSSIHAAGIIVCKEPITNFGGVNSKDNCIMMDKKDAEEKNLLKIDCLGLRTLSVLEEAIRMTGRKPEFFYSIPLDDDNVFQIFRDMRLAGVFQFEGDAVKNLCKKMDVASFDDVVALSAIARPGALSSGAAESYVKRRNLSEDVSYISGHEKYIKHTESTMGLIIYQEQLMQICRDIGLLSWEDVSEIRKGASKSLGRDFFKQYKEDFLKGAKENGIEKDIAQEIWENLITFGAYGFNLSHAVSYGYISYWCAYMKHYHPLEFACATLNHAKDNKSSIKILRDCTENDGINYVPVDPDSSEVNWTIKDGFLVGGLTNIDGIAEKKAKEIIKNRNAGIHNTKGLILKLIGSKTPFDVLYPCKKYFGDYYENPFKYGLNIRPNYISEIDNREGEYIFIGKITEKELKDFNEPNELLKRGGEYLSENNLMLRLTIEDDTDQIYCRINRFMFSKLAGGVINNEVKTDETYAIIKGRIKYNYRIIDIEAIHLLGEPE